MICEDFAPEVISNHTKKKEKYRRHVLLYKDLTSSPPSLPTNEDRKYDLPSGHRQKCLYS